MASYSQRGPFTPLAPRSAKNNVSHERKHDLQTVRHMMKSKDLMIDEGTWDSGSLTFAPTIDQQPYIVTRYNLPAAKQKDVVDAKGSGRVTVIGDKGDDIAVDLEQGWQMIRKLPSLVLHFYLPDGYPAVAPVFRLQCTWLPHSKSEQFNAAMQSEWKHVKCSSSSADQLCSLLKYGRDNFLEILGLKQGTTFGSSAVFQRNLIKVADAKSTCEFRSDKQVQEIFAEFANLNSNVNQLGVTSYDPLKASPNTKAKKTAKWGVLCVDDAFQATGITAKDVVVYIDRSGIAWDAALSQAVVQFNHYSSCVLQVVHCPSKDRFYFFSRSGRMGMDGETELTDCKADSARAQQEFRQKFLDLTGNIWDNRANFQKVRGLYDLVLRDHKPNATVSRSGDGDVNTLKTKVIKSNLMEEVQNLIKALFDLKMVKKQFTEINYDPKKSPLGILSDQQINLGYASLRKIEALINAGKLDGPEMEAACNEYYTRIPHDFGFSRPPMICTVKRLQRELDLLDTLHQVEILKVIVSKAEHADESKGGDQECLIDFYYKQLNTEITPVAPSNRAFTLVRQYLTAPSTTTNNSCRLELVELYELKKNAPFHDVGNRTLLWHGSRFLNFVGILTQGLLIAPPAAPVSGYMFGKGIYFADMSVKSANYCHCIGRGDTGLMLLCEVALGKSVECYTSQQFDKNSLPAGCSSVYALGQHCPNPSLSTTWEGATVPLGTTMTRSVDGTLYHNEFIVYDVQQVRMRYLLKVKFI